MANKKEVGVFQNAAETLAACLLAFAEAETNPVFEIIDKNSPMQDNKKYPAGSLYFNQLGWRAYYHCHPASRSGNHRFTGEHGHFHIFVRIHEHPEEWSHLAALAIDNMGQPLGWFTVNHWVTAETWLSAEDLLPFLNHIPYGQLNLKNSKENAYNLVEIWLLSLLSLSKEKIILLLKERDKLIDKKHPEPDNKKDKNIYLLSEVPISIMELLKNGDK